MNLKFKIYHMNDFCYKNTSIIKKGLNKWQLECNTPLTLVINNKVFKEINSGVLKASKNIQTNHLDKE